MQNLGTKHLSVSPSNSTALADFSSQMNLHKDQKSQDYNHKHHHLDYIWIKQNYQLAPQSIDQYSVQRGILKDAIQVHSYMRRPGADQEQEAQAIFKSLVDEIVKPVYNPLSHFIYDVKEDLEKSNLHRWIHKMPKGAHLHVHSTASVSMDYIIKQCSYIPNFWFNKEKKDIKYSKHPLQGYVELKAARNAHGDLEVDKMLKEMMLLNQIDIQSGESRQIWDQFQYKFTMTNDLFNVEFLFKKNIKRAFQEHVEDGFDRCEFRHVPQLMINEVRACNDILILYQNRNSVPAERQFQLISQALKQFQQDHPYFSAGIIVCSLKFLGKQHIEKLTRLTFKLKKQFGDLIVGIDAVAEQDKWMQSLDLANVFMQKAQLQKQFGFKIPYIFHGGESVSRNNDNLYDIVMLGTKRIGHGFGLFLKPSLIKTVKERDICIECCPLSNQVLGYVKDLRCHPARMLMNLGVPLVLSSDDPAFFGYSGCSLDILSATCAWQLSLHEIKGLMLNSIRYSEVSQEQKKKMYKHFETKWQNWIQEMVAAAAAAAHK